MARRRVDGGRPADACSSSDAGRATAPAGPAPMEPPRSSAAAILRAPARAAGRRRAPGRHATAGRRAGRLSEAPRATARSDRRRRPPGEPVRCREAGRVDLSRDVHRAVRASRAREHGAEDDVVAIREREHLATERVPAPQQPPELVGADAAAVGRQTSIVSSCPPPGCRVSSTVAPAARSADAARSTVATVSAVGAARSFSVCTATRTPRISTVSGSPSATGTTPPSRPSGPAMRLKTSATSATERASGPTWVRGSPSVPTWPSSSTTPVSGTRPALGLIDARPQKCAGRRTLAPESVPSPHGEPCAAMIAPRRRCCRPACASAHTDCAWGRRPRCRSRSRRPTADNSSSAEQDASRSLQASDRRCIRRRRHPGPLANADRHRNPGRRDVVLDRERNPMWRASNYDPPEATEQLLTKRHAARRCRLGQLLGSQQREVPVRARRRLATWRAARWRGRRRCRPNGRGRPPR